MNSPNFKGKKSCPWNWYLDSKWGVGICGLNEQVRSWSDGFILEKPDNLKKNTCLINFTLTTQTYFIYFRFTQKIGVVYFDQLLGAARTQELVETSKW